MTKPTSGPSSEPFEFAVGIECTFVVDERLSENPRKRRLEQFELMRHYEMWKDDLGLVAKLRSGDRRVTKLRWCFPWYRMQPHPGKFDFEWADQVVDYAEKLGIELVPDIVHYGCPEWMPEAFLDADYVERVTAFAVACAERYKGRIKAYTPLNEPYMTGVFSALRAEWPPYKSGLDSYIRVLTQICLGIQKTTKAIKAVDASAACWAVEVVHNYNGSSSAEAAAYAKEALRRDLVYWDMVHGKVDQKHEFYQWLLSNGATEKQLQQLLENAVQLDLIGLNFYPWTSKTVELKNGEVVEREDDVDGSRLLQLLRDVYAHTGAKLMVTETSAHGGGGKRSSSVRKSAPDMRCNWMDETMEAVRVAREEGLPVVGYTQFPLFTMVDWAYRVEEGTAEEYFLNLGMIEVDPRDYSRQWTPVADRFLHHMRTFETEATKSGASR